jgi:acylphosphatase
MVRLVVASRSSSALGRGILSNGMALQRPAARRFLIRGRVQGVGYRDFAQRAAAELGLKGFARNLDDGRVEVYAVGSDDKLSQFAGLLHRGPRWSDVRGVEETEEPVREHSSFRIEA